MPKSPYRLTDRQRPLSMMPCSNSPRRTPQTGNWPGNLRGRIWDIGGRALHRHGSLPTTLPHARIGDCLQSTPAAAAKDQQHYPDSNRLVRRPGSSWVRAGSSRSSTPRRRGHASSGEDGRLECRAASRLGLRKGTTTEPLKTRSRSSCVS